jgi:glycerophosphoryl diester phosphodiesterase
VLEIKPSPAGKERGQLIAERVVEMIRLCGVERITEYISFDFAILKKVQSLQPSALTHYLNGEKAPDEIKKEGISGIDYNISVYRKNPEWIKQAKTLGLVLNVWTVNDPDQLDWCINQSFDFITTNEPEYLLDRLKK